MEFKEFFATENDQDRRLDKIVRKLIHQQNLSQIYSCIRKGLIKVNQKKSSPDAKIQNGDSIKIPVFLLTEKIENSTEIKTNETQFTKNFETIYENNDIIIINKPYNILVHGNDTSLDKEIKKYFNTLQNKKASLSFTPGPLHRLDKKTTGLLTFSLSLAGAKWFSQNIATHTIKKTYIAILQGKLEKKEQWIDFICNEEKNIEKNFYTVKTNEKETDNSKKAISTVEPILFGKYKNNDYTLVKVIIQTGRTHQIRAQSAFHHYPLLGDTAYGGIKINESQDFFLHAIKLNFPEDNPLKIPQTIKTSTPKKWEDFLNKTSNDKILLNKTLEDII